MRIRQFADAMVVLIEDPSICGRLTHKDLAQIEGVLLAIVGWVQTELVKRDKRNERARKTKSRTCRGAASVPGTAGPAHSANVGDI